MMAATVPIRTIAQYRIEFGLLLDAWALVISALLMVEYSLVVVVEVAFELGLPIPIVIYPLPFKNPFNGLALDCPLKTTSKLEAAIFAAMRPVTFVCANVGAADGF